MVNNMAPFVWGGAEELATHLSRQLVEHGHQAEIMRVPFQWEPAERIPSQMLMARWLELDNVDHVIALKFPAYLVRHARKTLWILHQYRQAYDLFDVGQTNLPAGSEGERLRCLIRSADNEAFSESRQIFVNSPVTRDRLLVYNGFTANILLPPVNDPHLFSGGELGDYVFVGGRVNAMKRQHLAVEALQFADPRVKLVIAGPPDSPGDGERVREVVERLGLRDRVHLDLRFLPRDIYSAYVNGAAAVAYLPFDEDSLGYVAMEAATAGKALITTDDSGGILGLVKHGDTGWVTEPNPVSLADALSAACTNSSRARGYGMAARALWNSFGVNWGHTVEALLR